MPTFAKKQLITKTAIMIKASLATLSLAIMTLIASAEQIYINIKTGNDANPGTQSQPLKTLQTAAKKINANKQPEATTVFLSEGVYQLTETILIDNNKFTQENRLIIRAEIGPDDPNWNPQRMPVIVTPPPIPYKDEEWARGLKIEASHVTIEGLRFSVSPTYYYIDGKHSRCSYPIFREGKTLDDLLITQCLFAGDADLLPVRVAVIANGHGLVLDHCVFYHCENSVVFWDAEDGTSHHNAMRYCLVNGGHYTGVWTTKSTADDFEFHHNIIANSTTGWIKEGDHHYSIHDCIFTGNTSQAKTGTDTGPKTSSSLDFLQMENVQTTGTIEIEKDQSKNNYLQLKDGSFGSTLNTGLFKK